LWGHGGVGKTALAAEIARGIVEAYNDRVYGLVQKNAPIFLSQPT